MWKELNILPERASTFAEHVDLLFYFLVTLTVLFTALVFTLIFVFALRYRRRSDDERPKAILGDLRLELTWSIIPLFLALGVFAWSAYLYFTAYRPPSDSLEIYVVGKQWMWKLQHPEGRTEINELHVPVGQSVRLTMTSEDVIHSFYVPAFRIKMDVLPGRYTTAWFEATRTGEFHLFCAEYCGTQHSGMRGTVIVMEPDAYQAWLTGSADDEPMAVRGERRFQQMACATCHRPDSQGRGPVLDGLFGNPVALQTGETVVADEGYIRESILEPRAKLVHGYKPLMPTYEGQISEAGILELVEYIKSLGDN